MLFMGLAGMVLALLIVIFVGNDPYFMFIAGVNVGWGSVLVLIASVVHRAERKREQWWKKDD